MLKHANETSAAFPAPMTQTLDNSLSTDQMLATTPQEDNQEMIKDILSVLVEQEVQLIDKG